VGVVGVKKKKYSFHKNKQNVVNYEGFISRIEKMLSEESMCNVGVARCYVMNCCQHFLHEKTLLLKQKFWSLSFEDPWGLWFKYSKKVAYEGSWKQMKIYHYSRFRHL
jgi:hypothetical protein